jgi:copper(I)-binding protein
MKIQKFAIVLMVLALGLAGCASILENSTPAVAQNGIQIFDPWVRAAAAKPGMQGMHGGGAVTGAFMLIQNTNDEADMLLSASSGVADDVQIHETTMHDGVMSMAEVYGIELPAKSHVELKPGSYHIMLIGLKEELKAGDVVSIRLVFENAGEISVEAVVRNP